MFLPKRRIIGRQRKGLRLQGRSFGVASGAARVLGARA